MVEALHLDERLFNPMWFQEAALSKAQGREHPMFESVNSLQVKPPPGLAPPGLEHPRKVSLDSVLEIGSQISDEIGTQLRDNGSRVSCSTGHSFSACDSNCLGSSIAECKFLIDDLHNFRAMLLSRLATASQAFQPVDEELAAATSQVCAIIEELMTEAENLAMELSCASQNEVVALKLYGSLQPDVALEAVAKLSKLRTRTRKVRAEYLFILERLRYLSKCVEAVWDNSLDLGEGGSDLLELGLDQIDASCDFLEECSDFWIMLHKAELQLPDLCKEKNTKTKKDKRRA